MAVTLEQSRIELAGEYERVQKKAFTNWVNSILRQGGQKISDLYEDLKDGQKLILLLELLTGQKLRREKGKMRVHMLQNIQTALDFLQSKKIKLVNIHNHEILDGKANIILGLLWTLILHFQISDSFPSSSNSPTHQVSIQEAKAQLLEWAKTATEGYEEVSLTNFTSSWNNGLAFCAIVNRHRPDLLDYDSCDPRKPLENLEKAFSTMQNELGVARIVDPEDVCIPQPDEKCIMTYLSALHRAFPDMPPVHRKKVAPVSVDEYSQLHQQVKQWVRYQSAQLRNMVFPSSVPDMKLLLEQFQGFRDLEIPPKQLQMNELLDMFERLEVLKNKPSGQTIPPGMEHGELEVTWNALLKDSAEHELAMKEHLERLGKLEILTTKVRDQEEKVAEVEWKVKELEGIITSLPSTAGRQAQELRNEITMIQESLNGLSVDVEQLKIEGCHDLQPIEQKIDSLTSRLATLPSHLEGASTAMGELSEVEATIKQLEEWLVSCGHFTLNQHILEQFTDHKDFHLDQLEVARKKLASINSGRPLPPGMEDKMAEVNKRWEELVKHASERLSRLEPIVNIVQQFDALKDPLNEWVAHKCEDLESLLPLEVEMLPEQRKEMEVFLSSILERATDVTLLEELAEKFCKEIETVQSLAIGYAHKTGCSEKDMEELAEAEASMSEQALFLKGEYTRLKNRAEARASEIRDLLGEVEQFNQQLDVLNDFISKGSSLLASEKPQGRGLPKLEEQLHTCQVYMAQITSKEPQVKAMLALGRGIITKTTALNDSIMQKVTGFLPKWSDLQINWQNWTDEILDGIEKCRLMDNELDAFRTKVDIIKAACTKLLPTAVSVDSLDTQLQHLQDQFQSEVWLPLDELKRSYKTLEAQLLPGELDPPLMAKFCEVVRTVESLHKELADILSDVQKRWTQCTEVQSWLREVRESLVQQKALAGSIPVIREQFAYIKGLSKGVEDHRAQVGRSLTFLATLTTHLPIMNPSSIDLHKNRLQKEWEGVCEEVDKRRDLVSCGCEHLGLYQEQGEAFGAWLKEAEAQLEGLTPEVTNGERLLLQIQEFEAFTADIEAHEKDLDRVEELKDKVVGTAKAYQTLLLGFLPPTSPASQLKPDWFVDSKSTGNSVLGGKPPDFMSTIYENGLKVVPSYACTLRGHYDTLLTNAKRRRERLLEGKSRREELDGLLEALHQKLSELEGTCDMLSDNKEISPEKIQARMEALQALEMDCLSTEPMLQSVHSAYSQWMDVLQDEMVPKSGDSDAFVTKCSADNRYHALMERVRCQKELLHAELSNAQAFHDAYGSFVTWLRETERKIQRGELLKLELRELKSWLGHLQSVSGDITAREKSYDNVKMKCQQLLAINKALDAEELTLKLENLQERWNGLGVVQDDIQVINETIPKLEAFRADYNQCMTKIDSILEHLEAVNVSAVCSKDIDAIKSTLQALTSEADVIKPWFAQQLASYNLSSTPFDHDSYEQDIVKLYRQLERCEQLSRDRHSHADSLQKKVVAMEELFKKFNEWLKSSEQSLQESIAVKDKAVSYQQLKVIRTSVVNHSTDLVYLQKAVKDLHSLLSQDHRRQLGAQATQLGNHYHALNLSVHCALAECWQANQLGELCAMGLAGVSSPVLLFQLAKLEEFQHGVEGFRPEIDELCRVAEQCGGGGEGGSHDNDRAKVLAGLMEGYERLKSLGASRSSVLGNFRPQVQLYESSHDAWSRLLQGWRERAAALPPPSCMPDVIQKLLAETKELQLSISDHVVEFTSLKRESQKLFSGSSQERSYLTQLLTQLPVEGTKGLEPPRPGQVQLELTLNGMEAELEGLREKLASRMKVLGVLLERSGRFHNLMSALMGWVAKVQGEVGELDLTCPSSTLVESKLHACQRLQEELASQNAVKEELMILLDALTEELPAGEVEPETLRAKLEALKTSLSSIADILKKHQSNLESALPLAKAFEEAECRLCPWVGNTRERLEGLGTLPAEAQQVQKLKSELEGLRTTYFSLIAPYSSFCKNGEVLASLLDTEEARAKLTQRVTDLQADWTKLGVLFSDILQRLSSVLMESQAFQKIADDLDKWMVKTSQWLEGQGLVAVQADLVTAQIESFKPVVADINAYSNIVEQAKMAGEALKGGADVTQGIRIEEKLADILTQFSHLGAAAKIRMNELEEAKKSAVAYESHSSLLEKWLATMEGKLSEMDPLTVASQPLGRQEHEMKELAQQVESYVPTVEELTSLERVLFGCDQGTLVFCEHQFCVADSVTIDETSIESKVPHVIWLRRPGVAVPLQVGANLRGRFVNLKLKTSTLRDEAAQLLEHVLQYERAYDRLSHWMKEEAILVKNLGPLSAGVDKLKQQLKQVQDHQCNFKSKEEDLSAVNSMGTSLVDSCIDPLTKTSARTKLSDINELWSHTLAFLDTRQDNLEQAIAHATKYESLRNQFDLWLSGCEARLVGVPKNEDDPAVIVGQLSELETLSKEATEHRGQLTAVIIAGHTLESSVAPNGPTPPDLGYKVLEDRYTALVAGTQECLAAKKAALGQVSDLLNGLRQLNETLAKWDHSLETLEPVSTHPSTVEQQLAELTILEKSFTDIQPSLLAVEEEGKTFVAKQAEVSQNLNMTVAEIQGLLASISTANSKVGDKLKYWKSRLLAGLEATKKYHSLRAAFSSWLKEKGSLLGSQMDTSGTLEGVKEQLRNIQALQDDITTHKGQLETLIAVGRALQDVTSPKDAMATSEQLAATCTAFDALQAAAKTRRHVLEDARLQVTQFAEALQEVMVALETKASEIQQLGPIGSDLEAIQAQMEEHREFEKCLQTLVPRVDDVRSKGKALQSSCAADDRPYIADQLDKMNALWHKVNSEGLGRKHSLESALLQLGQFHEAVAEFLHWVNTTTAGLNTQKLPGTTVETTEAHLRDLETLERTISSKEPGMLSLQAAGKAFASPTSPPSNNESVEKDLEDLNSRWDALKCLVRTRRQLLSEALAKAKAFHEEWRQLNEGLSGMENKIYAEWVQHGLPEPCEADLTEHQALMTEILGYKPSIEALEVTAVELKKQGSPEEQGMVDRWLDSVHQRWQDVVGAMEERKTQMEVAKEKASEFEQCYKALGAKLSSYDGMQKQQAPICSDAVGLKRQLAEHKELMRQLQEVEAEVDQLDGMAQLLSKDCVPEDGDTILQQSAAIRSQWEGLQTKANERQSLLDDSFASLGKFEEAYDDLWAWLQDCLRQLRNPDDITGDPAHVNSLLAKHRTLQKQLGTRLQSRTAVTKASKVVLKQKEGDEGERAVLKKKLQELDQEWENVCSLAVQRQSRLEDAAKELYAFQSHVNPLQAWMSKVLPSVDTAEPVFGDEATVESLIDTHKSFQTELDSHQPSYDSANTSGQRLIGGVLDDPALTDQALEEMREKWEELCLCSAKKQEMLDIALEAAHQFVDQYKDLLLWVEAQLAEVQSLPPPRENAEELQKQISEHQAFTQDVSIKQASYDKFKEESEDLLQRSHPQAVPAIQQKLQYLERKWVGLRGHIGARGEDLASAMMDLHGLQEALDGLSEWVDEAEAKMTYNEGLLLTNSLDDIEDQLQEHEKFQEDMAAQQPNMDALNKVAKKKAAANPQGNPELAKKVANLYKRWQKLWLRSSERHRQLLEARTRLKDIAMARSFDFEAWRQRFVACVVQNKLRVNDLFRRFDGDHDGMLTKEEVMKGLKASGLAMTQIELEKVANMFDKGQSGCINLSEMVAVLKGTSKKQVVSQKVLSDTDKIDIEIQQQVSKCTCAKPFKVVRVGEGQYRFGDSQKMRLVRILRSSVMVRVGGGWEPLDKFLEKNDPCRAKGRTTTEIQLGLTKAVFTTKIPPARNTKRPTDTSEETVGACCSDEHEDTPPREGSASRESTPSAPSTPVKHATTTYHSKMEAPLSRSTAASPTPGKKRVIPAPTNKIPVPKSAVPKSKIPKPQ